MKLSKALEEIEEWLDEMTYRYEVTKVEVLTHGVCVTCVEYEPLGEMETFILTVESDGVIINQHGDDVVEVGLDVYDDNPDTIQWLNDFKNKWYRR